MLMIDQLERSDRTLLDRIDYVVRQNYSGNLSNFIRSAIPREVFPRSNKKLLPTWELYQFNLFTAIWRYLGLKGLRAKYAGLRPYHLHNAPDGTYNNPSIIDEVVRKIFRHLFRNVKGCQGNLAKLISTIKGDDIPLYLTDLIAGEEFRYSTTMTWHKFDQNLYRLVWHYIALEGLEDDFRELQPYHMLRASHGIYNNPTVVNQVIRKIVNNLLQTNLQCQGQLIKLAKVLTAEDLKTPIVETIAGQEFRIDTAQPCNEIGGPFRLFRHYLEMVKASDELLMLRPYHFSGAPKGTYDNPTIVNEVVKKVVQNLLVSKEEIGGDPLKLIKLMRHEYFEAPLVERIGGESFEVSLHALFGKFGSSLYAVIRHYLELEELTGSVALGGGYNDLKPYHMPITTLGTHDDLTIVNEMVRKKVRYLLQTKEDCGGSLIRLVRILCSNDLLLPFFEVIGGEMFEVSTRRLCLKFGSSPYRFIRHFIEMSEVSAELRALRPYHMAETPQMTYDDLTVVNEVVRKIFDHLLNTREGCNGNLAKLIRILTQDDILVPIIEYIDGEQFIISPHAAAEKFASSPYRMAMHYIDLESFSEDFKGLRPYHMGTASQGTSQNPTMVNEIVGKMFQSFMATNGCNGNLAKLIRLLRKEDLVTPLVETIAGEPFSVSTHSVAAIFDVSPYRMLRHYIAMTGRERDFVNLRPHHMTKMPQGSFDDPEFVDELICRSVGRYIDDACGNEVQLERALSTITGDLLMQPFVDMIDGEVIEVPLSGLMFASNWNCYPILKRYAELRDIRFPYTQRCFMGSPETRLRRMRGQFSEYDITTMKDASGHYDVSIFGLSRFNADEKQVVRVTLVEEGTRILGDANVCYLGFETAEFGSLKLIAELMNLAPERSVVVEQDGRTANAMRAMAPKVNHRFARLDIIHDEMEIAIQGKVKGSFNFVYLDFIGVMNKRKEEIFQHLLQRRLLQKTAVVFVTLWDEQIARVRAERGGYGQDQVAAVKSVLQRYARGFYDVSFLFDLPYLGGKNGKNTTSMVTMGFVLTQTTESADTEVAN